MHEYSIVGSLIDRIEREAAARGATMVTAVSVSIGELSGVEAGLLATAYDTFRERTICEAAALRIKKVPARWACPRCERTIAPGDVLRCGECDKPARLVEGDEILLDRIEMEVPDV